MPRRDGGPRRLLTTVLFTDIVGSTKLAEEMGDRQWREVLRRHHAVIRREIKNHHGREIDTAGDGFFAVFDQPADAIACGLAASGELHRLGIDIRAGVHMGEVEMHGDDISGIAVHVGARVMSKAGPGQVLVSGTVRELMAGSDIRFEDAGFHELKGVATQQHLFSVQPVVEEAPAAPAPAILTEPEAPAPKPVLTPPRLIGAIALAVVIAVLAIVLPGALKNDDTPAAASTPPGMAIIDAKSGQQRAFIPRSKVKQPLDVFYLDGHYWIMDGDPWSFVEIDPRSGRILKTIASPYDNGPGYSVDGDTLWATDYDHPEMAKISISRGRVVDRFRLTGQFGSLVPAVGAGSVWVPQKEGAPLLRLDPDTGTIQHRFDDIPYASGVVFADGAAWVASGVGKVFRIDPATNAYTSGDLPSGTSNHIAAGGGYGWSTNEAKGVVYQTDSNGRLVDTFHTGEGALSVSFSDGTLWVGNQDVGTVTGIDAVTGKQRTYAFGHPLQGIAAGSGTVLVQMNPGRTYEDRIEALQGKVAKLLIQAYSIETPDPAVAGGPVAFQVEYATCAPLLSYGDSGEVPAKLAPEVAAAMPDVSQDGRTYTFTVRDGFSFSPPSNQPVTAETFRSSIERALSPRMGEEAQGSTFIDDIVGEAAFLDGEGDHISGLRADGNRLTITLVKPSGSFLARLSMSYFCPVPTDTPIVPGGTDTTIPGTNGAMTTAAAGPYYVADKFNGEYSILKRNPNYGGSRPQALDAIALREGVDAGVAIQRVQSGSWDGITNIYDEALAPYGDLAGQDGGSDDPAYDARPLPGLDFLALNTQRPLFASMKARRAVSLVLDRAALAAAFQEVGTANLISPTFTKSFSDPSVPAPDVDAARELLGGRHFDAVMASYAGCVQCRAFVESVKASLAKIGIAVTVRDVDDPVAEASKPGTDIDLYNAFVVNDVADAPLFLLAELTDAMPATWLPPGVEQDVKRVDALGAGQRTAAAVQLAGRLATNEIPVVSFAAGATTAYLAPSLGCRVFPPYGYGLDLAALCLQ